MKKVIFLVIATLLTGLFVTIFPSGLAQASTPVNGIINSDTTWTKTNSPYSFTGPIAVNRGVTLTIEAGTVVNLNYYYLQVNGTLIAKGTIVNQIQFNGGNTEGITFTLLSNSWNEQTESGSIIQNAIIKSNLYAYSIKIDHNNVSGSFGAGGSSVVTNNMITGGIDVSGSSTVSNNIISGTLSAGPVEPASIVIATSDTTLNDHPTITNNTINGRDPYGGGEIGISCYQYAKITNNRITNCEEGVRIFSSQTSGYPVIERNAIYGNQMGIVILASQSAPESDQPLIEDNLITSNNIGISVEREGGISTPTIQNNNIYSNNLNLGWGPSNNIDITNNWWGTTNVQAINQTIGDFKNDFNQGMVNFVPFLTQPNPNAPTLSPGISPTPSEAPEVPEFSIILVISALVSLAVFIGIIKKEKGCKFD